MNENKILTSLRRRLPELLPTLRRVVPEPPSRKGAGDLVPGAGVWPQADTARTSILTAVAAATVR